MSDDQDESQKTEEPTQKKIDDALKKGQVVFSREVVSFFMFLAFALILSWILPGTAKSVQHYLLPFIEQPESIAMDEGNMGKVLLDACLHFLMFVGVPMAAVVIAIIAGSMIQKPITFTMEPAKPQLSRISPMAGAKRIFSRRSLTEFLKGLVKMGLVGILIYNLLMKESSTLHKLGDTSGLLLLESMSSASFRMVMSVAIAMFFIAMMDYLYQRFEYRKNLRMSKQDLKEEYKQQEGDPHIKQKIRALRRERASKRMMANVPKSDVVITNPTHFAVALKYDPDSMDAPRVVAKGADKVAFRIREMAEDNKVPVLRNPPLARALYDTVEVDEPIKMEHYKAVAEVIGYVYRMKGKKMSPTQNATIPTRKPGGRKK